VDRRACAGCAGERDGAVPSDNFCDPGSLKYRDKCAEIARRPTYAELHDSWRRARTGLSFEITTFERRDALRIAAMLAI
jgi:putative pyruvate formate lyase activating enzyme